MNTSLENLTHKMQRAAVGKMVDVVLSHADKDPEKTMGQIVDLAKQFYGSSFSDETYERAKKTLSDPDSKWSKLINSVLDQTDPHVARTTALNLGYEAFFRGTKTIRENRVKYQCNIPWLILFDPTSACNMHCVGCWAGEYGNKNNLSFEDMDKIVTQGKELGTYMYLYTGGEPTMRRKDLMRICRENPDCAFLSFTNGTLIDDSFADEIREVGNFYPAFSIEGYEEENDFRRGAGTFQKCTAAMKRLKDRGVPFGASLCYTSKNTDVLASDEYMDWLIDQGVKFAWFFTYMPTGNGAVTDLMVSPEQRALMYKKMHEWRHTKPIFALDFWNDGEYVQGCIAGGRHYFHINSNGDCEPCAFVHYSNVNIKECSVLDALQSPLFMAYKRNQPFSNNMLRPCPVLDNPGAISKMVAETGAYSTEMQHPESANELYDKTIGAAKAWKVKADELFDRDKFIAKHVKDENMYNFEKSDDEREFQEFEKTEA